MPYIIPKRRSGSPPRHPADRRGASPPRDVVNHKRVVRLMREDGLLAVQPKSFVVTTDSNHELEVYLNLARRMKLTAINRIWVADITQSIPSDLV